ncbi:integrase [Lentibacillus lipolyticus]|nr:integrase [Lentibacillus lipolyticus]
MNLVKSFEQWLIEEGKAKTTIQSYVGDVQAFQSFLEEKVADDELLLSRFAFVRYKQYLVEEGFAPSTINKKVNSLKVYNDFLRMKGMVEESFIQMKKDKVVVALGSEHVVTALSDKEVEQLLFYVEDRRKVTMRNKLIVYLLLYTGVRVTELVNIQQKDIDFLTSTLTIKGKGGKIRELSLRADVIELIEEYRKGDRMASSFRESPYLLVSQRSPKMHRDAVRDWLANISNELGFKLHPHLFRHTFCTKLLKKGVDLTTVSKLAGHGSVNMTAKYYIQTTREDKKNAVELL